MASTEVLKLISATLMLVCGTLGGFSPSCFAHHAPRRLISFCDAFSSGVLLSVATCHMLADGVSGVNDSWGRAISSFFGQDCRAADVECKPFSAGLMLFLLGIFAMLFVSYINDEHSEEQQKGRKIPPHRSLSDLAVVLNQQNASEAGQPTPTGSGLGTRSAGIGTLVAVSLHSIIEGVAVGAAPTAALGFVVVLHKYFAAFAVGSSLRANRTCCKYAGVVFFGVNGPVAVVAGMLAAANLEGVWSDALSCTAAGTLIEVAFCDMLLPGLQRHLDLR